MKMCWSDKTECDEPKSKVILAMATLRKFEMPTCSLSQRVIDYSSILWILFLLFYVYTDVDELSSS